MDLVDEAKAEDLLESIMSVTGIEHPVASGDPKRSNIAVDHFSEGLPSARSEFTALRAVSPAGDHVEISAVARELEARRSSPTNESDVPLQTDSLTVEFLPRIVRSVLVRLSDRFYDPVAIEKQIAEPPPEHADLLDAQSPITSRL